MTLLAGVSLLALAIAVISDIFFPGARGTEVWFGFEVTGTPALLTAPLHWMIFAVGAWACWTQQPWALPAFAGYLFYSAFSHLVWSEVSANGRGWPIGLLQAIVISSIALLVLRARHWSTRQ
jgi:hypothetical protein